MAKNYKSITFNIDDLKKPRKDFPDTKDWLEIEKYLEKKEKEILAKEGVILPEGHLSGYKYFPKTKIADKQPWEVTPTPNRPPTCMSFNWTHREVGFDVGEGIAYITLRRPEASNSLNEGIQKGLEDAVFELHQRKDVRIVVLQAEGKMFCAGGDPKSFADAHAMTDADNRRSAVMFMKFLYYFQSLPQFTIGLAQGSAMGSGLALLACCDLVAAVQNARFTCSEVKLGTVPATIAPFITTKVGVANSKRLLCLGDNLTAEAARQMGLIQEVVEDDSDFSNVVAEICEKLTLCAPQATARSKKLVQNVNQRPFSPAMLEYTGNELATIRVADEAVKGMVAVQAKTKPFWVETPIKPLY